ncbi:MAG: aminotransferase class V-fold PLP-dependent enzyme, partial [Chitinophagaceae bacterium]
IYRLNITVMKRRNLLKTISLLPLAGIAGAVIPTQSVLAETPDAKGRDIIEELGMRSFINAAGNYTVMTGSLMPEEVMQAINNSSKKFVLLDEVQDKVGVKIAAICHAEAATVTAGCWSALMLGMAGVVTGMDTKKVSQLPFLEDTGMKSQVIMQKSHSLGYDHALTQVGVTLLTVETREELEKAINDKTAMLWFLNREAPKGQIKHEEWIQIAKKHNIPSMIDIAADVPPVENLWKFNDMGFDLVAISGGKAMCGPQSAGILMGKKELIAAARLSANPRNGIGRGQKVNKEEIIGMYVALEKFVNTDHKKQWKKWEDKIAVIDNAVKSILGVTTEVIVPPTDNNMPTLKISWDAGKVKLTREEMGQKLRLGTPSIEVISWEAEHSIRVAVHPLQPGEEKSVGARIKEELTKAFV